jgi:enoyl-CoA hydratase/carnithine racemase
MSHSNIAQYGPAITWVTSSTVMSSSNVVWEVNGSIATLTFNRPHARNALTWEMYDAVHEACERVDASREIRVLIIRGAGGAFSSGTDIAQFADFATGNDGIAYERRLDAVVDRLEDVSRVTIAAIDGVAAGGGCALALACDFRLCTTGARLGVPVARTLGNCLSVANLARLLDRAGTALTTDLLLTGRLVDAHEALAARLVNRVIPADQFVDQVLAFARQAAASAPSTVQATKAMLRRIRAHRRPPAADDIVAACYASDEFREGVRAFQQKRSPGWLEP